MFALLISIQELKIIVGDDDEKYTRDWYARHRTAPEEGSDRPGKTLGCLAHIVFENLC